MSYDYKNINTIVFKTTTSCNNHCKYCYELKEDISFSEKAEFMLYQILEKSNENEINIIFHGGEPLLQVKSIIYLIHKINKYKDLKKVNFNIQTNGLLLKDVINKLKEINVTVSVSLDSLETDFRNNKEINEEIVKNIKLLKENNISVAVLISLNKSNIKNVFHLISKLNQSQINYKINNIYSSTKYQCSNKQIKKFWQKYFKKCDPCRISQREYKDYLTPGRRD